MNRIILKSSKSPYIIGKRMLGDNCRHYNHSFSSLSLMKHNNRSAISVIDVFGSRFAVRSFSVAKEKLRAVLEEYRENNYRQTLPSRFAKELTEAADVNHDGFISLEEVMKLLENIGAKEKMTKEELAFVIDEMNEEADNHNDVGVPVDFIVKYLKGKV